jgi:hypothetical protein
MPFTPFHMGPGMAVKAAADRHFSIVVFGMTQVAFDLEVLWYLWRWEHPFHRFWHTYLGATIIAVVFAIVGKPVSQRVKSIWNRFAARCGRADLSVTVRTTWISAFTAAVIGAYSHILLDSLYHPDMAAFLPWYSANQLGGVFRSGAVEIGCVLFGLCGLAAYLLRYR